MIHGEDGSVILRSRYIRVLCPTQALPFVIEQHAREAARKQGMLLVRRATVDSARMLGNGMSDYRCRIIFAELLEEAV